MKWGHNIPFYGQENSYYMALDTDPYIILLTQIQLSVYTESLKQNRWKLINKSSPFWVAASLYGKPANREMMMNRAREKGRRAKQTYGN